MKAIHSRLMVLDQNLCPTVRTHDFSEKKKTFENIVGKDENGGNQHFLLFRQYYLPYYIRILMS